MTPQSRWLWLIALALPGIAVPGGGAASPSPPNSNVPLAAQSFIGNPGVEADDRGRIPYWGEEKTDSISAGRRGGTLHPDPDVTREGKYSVRVRPTNDWFAVSSVNYPLAPWTDRYEFSGWARTEPSGSTRLLACWTDDSQNVVRVDASQPLTGDPWQRIVLTPPSAPTKATNVRLVAVARGGAAWFDEFDLLRLPPSQKRLRVFVNQVGYELNGPKTAVIAANFLPASPRGIEVEVNSPDDKVRWKQSVAEWDRVHSGTTNDWGWYFWRADFSSLRRADIYTVQARAEGVRAQSPTFQIEKEALLKQTAQSAVDFFYIQRCGFAVPGWHAACHLDDANLTNGAHIDAIGGWHSAGDYNKLMYENGDGGVVYALLSAQQRAPEIFARHDRNADQWCDALDEAEWGAKFVARMQIPETGGLRNHVKQGPGREWAKWLAPEVHTDNQVGTADDPVIEPGEGNSPLVIGGWAKLSTLINKRGASSDYLDRAEKLWKHATKDGTQLGSPLLLLSSIDLHRVTGKDAYLDYSRRAAQGLLSQQSTNGQSRGAFGDYGELTAGALASLALAYPKGELELVVRCALTNYTTMCMATAKNPFGLCTRTTDPNGEFFPSDLGNNFQLLMRAWAAGLVFRVTHDHRALVFATDQMDWVLGKNPIGLCMFEGKGALNPPRYHHRYNAIPGHERGAVPGTIPNGFVREMGMADRPGFDLSRAGGRSPSHRTSEPWLVHNMWYFLALTASQN